MSMVLLLLLALSSFRLTRLITRDKLPVIDLPREAFVSRWGAWQDARRITDGRKRNRLVRMCRWLFGMEWEAIGNTTEKPLRTNLFMKSIAYLWECDWCMGIWVSAGVVYATQSFMSVPRPYLYWIACAALTGLLSERESSS